MLPQYPDIRIDATLKDAVETLNLFVRSEGCKGFLIKALSFLATDRCSPPDNFFRLFLKALVYSTLYTIVKLGDSNIFLKILDAFKSDRRAFFMVLYKFGNLLKLGLWVYNHRA